MSHHDLRCPYCDAPQDVCHDDGHGCEEDTIYEQECRKCEKTYTFFTDISFSYRPSKADCLNGSAHNLKLTSTYPCELSRMRCRDCGFERKPTAEELLEKQP